MHRVYPLRAVIGGADARVTIPDHDEMKRHRILKSQLTIGNNSRN
jgi:hypothetical protein